MPWFFGSRKSLVFALALAFVLAIGIRFYDLTDLPLDFAPTRQLFSALKARSMYYDMLPASTDVPAWQREMADQQKTPVIEPPVIETLTALTYRIFGEHLWIARIYSSLFWVLAGILLFLLAKELAGSSGAFISLLYYLFLPYGVIASRAFQPDPLMVALIVAGAWATFRWANTRAWKWAVMAGILNGLAIFVKNVAVFPLAFAALALVFERGLARSLKDRQTWAVAGLSALPAGIYTVYGLFGAGFLGQQFAFRFFPQLWLTPAFYLQWKGQVDGVIGFAVFAVAVAGLFVARRRGMAFLAGLFSGYFVYGMTFAYHITTHDYYQLPLIPIAALGLAPVAETLFETAIRRWVGSTQPGYRGDAPGTVDRLGIEPVQAGELGDVSEAANRLGAESKKPGLAGGGFARVLLAALIMLVAFIQIWNVRVELIREDWRPDAEFWTVLGEKLGHEAPVLTFAQDYGLRLAYWGWQEVDSWYYSGDLEVRALDNRQIDVMQRFDEQAAGKKYFVVTQLGKFEEQAGIYAHVTKTYPVFAEGKGYIIFDLTRTK